MSAARPAGGASPRHAGTPHEAEPWPQGVCREPVMKIGQVVEALRTEFPALSLSKVRYLEGEGLISPHRMGNGYRRYSRADVARLRFTLTAQRDEYLPLSVIRERLDRLDSGQDQAEPEPVARVVAAHGRIVAADPVRGMDLAGLCARTGAATAEVEELVGLGLVTPDARGRYDAQAAHVVSLVRSASHRGVPVRNLRAVRTAAEREADTIEQTVAPSRRRSADAGREAAAELAGILAELHGVLLRRAVDVVV